MDRAAFKALEDAHNQAFVAYLRCECKNRLTKKGCRHAQECCHTRQVWYAAYPSMGLVAPDHR